MSGHYIVIATVKTGYRLRCQRKINGVCRLTMIKFPCYSVSMQSIDNFSLTDFCQSVQHNCAISDARFARDYSLCIYLLRMREFFRWKNKINLGAPVCGESLGSWVSDTEAHWDDIEETDYVPLMIDDVAIDPFDTTAVNNKLTDRGLIYTAGIGRLGQPHFVLARLQNRTITDDVLCIECGEELARDTITLPAMAQNGTVIIRHESVTHLLWQMVDEWSVKKPAGPMARVVEHYSIDLSSQQLEQKITAAAKDLSDLMRYHEFGEIAAGDRIGEGFAELTMALQGKRGEMQVRAVRDLLADSLRTWPFIEREQSSHHLDFWLAGLTGYREVLLKQTPVFQSLTRDRIIKGESDTRLQSLTNLIEPEQARWTAATLSSVSRMQPTSNIRGALVKPKTKICR